MNIKRILASTMFLLPFAVTAIPNQASALEVIGNHNGHNAHVQTIAKNVVQVRHNAPPVRKKVLVPGHWEKTNHGRKWVPAHYVYK